MLELPDGLDVGALDQSARDDRGAVAVKDDDGARVRHLGRIEGLLTFAQRLDAAVDRVTFVPELVRLVLGVETLFEAHEAALEIGELRRFVSRKLAQGRAQSLRRAALDLPMSELDLGPAPAFVGEILSKRVSALESELL